MNFPPKKIKVAMGLVINRVGVVYGKILEMKLMKRKLTVEGYKEFVILHSTSFPRVPSSHGSFC